MTPIKSRMILEAFIISSLSRGRYAEKSDQLFF
jgi:hypothetical protein